jgi:hypothetical protein
MGSKSGLAWGTVASNRGATGPATQHMLLLLLPLLAQTANAVSLEVFHKVSRRQDLGNPFANSGSARQRRYSLWEGLLLPLGRAPSSHLLANFSLLFRCQDLENLTVLQAPVAIEHRLFLCGV